MEFEIINSSEEWASFISRLAYNGGYAPYPVNANEPASYPVIAAYLYISDSGGEHEGWLVDSTNLRLEGS